MSSISGISGISSVSAASGQQSQGLNSLMKKLLKSLQSGDQASAQQAYSSITNIPWIKHAMSNPSSGNNGAMSSFINALSKLGSDLSNNKLGAAQQDFADLQQKLQNIQTGGSKHHGHHHNVASSSDSGNSDPLSQLLNEISNIINTAQSSHDGKHKTDNGNSVKNTGSGINISV